MEAVFLVLIAVTFVRIWVALAYPFSDSEGFRLVVQFVIFPLFFLSGAIFPVESPPNAVQLLAYVEGLRAVLIGTSAYPLVVDLGTLLVSSVVMVGIGTYLFERVDVV